MISMGVEYEKERERLSEKEIDTILESGKKWDITDVLQTGGSAIFPHTYLHACGAHIAAVVNGCLDSQSDSVLVLGVIHSMDPEVRDAKEKEKQGAYMACSNSHGVWGPGIAGHRCWEIEFSLRSFEFLFYEAVKRRGKKAPKLILRYPTLVGGCPEKLKGIEELVAIAKDSVVVATGDLCHNGIAYINRTTQPVYGFGSQGYVYAKQSIQHGFDLLDAGCYSEYMKHCYLHLNDSIDSFVVLRHILGPTKSEILDLQLVDVAELYKGNPKESWVAATLALLRR